MNTKQIKNIIGIVITIIVLLAVGILLTLFWRSRRTGEGSTYNLAFGILTSPVETALSYELTTGLNIKLDNIGSTNNVYRIDTTDEFFPSETLVKSVAKELNLKSEEDGNKVQTFTNSEADITLTYNGNLQSITLKYTGSGTSVQPDIPPDKEAEIYAKDKLQEVGLWPFREGYLTSYRYYYTVSYSYYETSNRDEADLIGVNFSSKINDIPLISSRISSGEIEVLMDSSKQVKKISYAYRPISQDVIGTYPLKNTSTALSKLASGEGEIVSSFGGENPESMTISNAILAYRVEYKEQEFLQPVYVFEGEDENGEIVTVIVAAISDQYLINP